MFAIRTMLVLCLILVGSRVSVGQLADPWQTEYQGEQATGKHVIGLWQFNEDQPGADLSGNKHTAKIDGATIVGDGKFGGGLQSDRGFPIVDKRHAALVQDADALSPPGAFTIELWLRPGKLLADYGEAFLLDKKYVSHDDYQMILGAPSASGSRRLRMSLGFGDRSLIWYANEAKWEADTWYHVAFTYDGAGRGQFFRDGQSFGDTTRPGVFGIHPGRLQLSIGDRVGSNFRGFPGTIDQVRLSNGVREFRPIQITPIGLERQVFVRMEQVKPWQFQVQNLTNAVLENVTASVSIGSVSTQTLNWPQLTAGEKKLIEVPLETSLRPDSYDVTVALQVPSREYSSHETFPLTIVARERPHRMPVVMWGINSVESFLAEIDRLKEIGFTHCLGLRVDYNAIWEAGKPVAPAPEEQMVANRAMLDEALKHDLGIVGSFSPGRWYFDRLPKDDTRGITEQLPELLTFCRNVGESIAQAWGSHPAFDAALIHTEVRDSVQMQVTDSLKAAYNEATGGQIPPEAKSKGGVDYTKLPNFPANRIIADENPIYRFYQWYWRNGDGWNQMHSAVNEGLKSGTKKDFWTFFDPAVRVPSIYGSGGNVDVISQWTYSYPDPIRIGLATDELLAMAGGSTAPQQVMKMTQIIWYRSQTAPAPEGARPEDWGSSPWEDTDPDAAFITISPMHLREAFWSKIARPIQGIMYHGWQSLVPVPGEGGYRFTHNETQHELARLVKEIVEPLGPMLRQVPAAKSDVAFLESFASQMFARRGTYGWGRGWGADAYLALRYAQLQPDIVYDETIVQKGLDQYKVLVMCDCDVITSGMLAEIQEFQKRGGIVIGDERLTPAVKADILLPVYLRTRKAQEDKAALLTLAAELREKLDSKYQRHVDSSNPDAIAYRRQAGAADYIFAINDHREYGEYVGHHKLVMENGLPTDTTFTIRRPGATVYDLVEHRQIPVTATETGVAVPLHLSPGGGAMLLVTNQPIASVKAQHAEEVQRGQPLPVKIQVLDAQGKPLDAVVPLDIRINDPDGREAEYSGSYGAANGQLELKLDIARNDTPGLWEIEVQDLASGLRGKSYFRVGK